MAIYQKQPIQHTSKKKISISYIIRDKVEKYHRSGINSLQYDPILDRLYSAGRDSTIRAWNFEKYFNQDHNHSLTSSHNNNDFYNRPSKHTNDFFLHSMEHHTDWVNDIILCCNNRNIISVSNDTTIKIWNAHQGYCLSTLRSHKDYAKCLAYAKDKEVVASAGFDQMIYLWDIQTLTNLTATNNTVTTKPLERCKSSIYSLAINQSASLVASGSTEKVIALWDPRTRQKILKLRGHTDNVRCLLLSPDSTHLLSGSSDGTIRLWSIPQQRCMAIIRVHDEGVWALQTNETFSVVYSGGKDGKLFMSDLKNTTASALVCQESAPILKLLLVNTDYSGRSNARNSSMWIATTNSSIKNWSLNSSMLASLRSKWFRVDDACGSPQSLNDFCEKPVQQEADVVIKGSPSILGYHILNDKRYILTKESDGGIVLYDVLTARKVEQIRGPQNNMANADQDFEEQVKKRFKMVYVPNWFTVDLKIGMLCLHLVENECFSAWVSAKDYGFVPPNETQDPKVNLGSLMLQALFEYWPRLRLAENMSDFDSKSSTLNTIKSHMSLDQRQQHMVSHYFSVSDHIPIFVSEANQTLMRFQAYGSINEHESLYLRDILPVWITDVIVNRCTPKLNKIPFFLLPHSDSGIKSLRKERLSASDMLQVKKVIEHICEKMLVNLDDDSTTMQERSSSRNETQCDSPNFSFTDKVELLCNERILDLNLDLRTIKHYFWKSGGDLVLHYLPIKENK